MALVVLVICSGYMVRLFRYASEVTIPDPKHYPAKRVVAVLDSVGFRATVDEVKYVNLDVNAYIYKGTVEAFKDPEPKTGYVAFVKRRRLAGGRYLVAMVMGPNKPHTEYYATFLEPAWTYALAAEKPADERDQVVSKPMTNLEEPPKKAHGQINEN